MLRFLLILTVVIALFLHNLPYLIRDQAVIWLLNNGAETAQLKAVKIDWFAGAIEIEELTATAQGRPNLKVERLRVMLDYAQLPEKRLLLSRVDIEGVQSGIDQQVDALWLGPINLNRFQSEQDSPPSDAEPSEWSFGLAQLHIDGFDWQAKLPGQQHRLVVNQGRLADFYLWDQQQPVAIDLDGSLNGAPVSLSSRSKPLPQEKSSELQIKLNNFPVQSVTALILPELRAMVDLDLSIKVNSDFAANVTRLSQAGTIRVRDFAYQQAGVDIQQEQLSWKGDVDLALQGNELRQLTSRSDIKSAQFGLILPDTQVQTDQLDLKAELKMQGLDSIEINNAQIGIQTLAVEQAHRRINAGQLDTVLDLSSADLKQWRVNASQIALKEAELNTTEPLIKLAAADVKGLQLEHTDTITLERLGLQGLVVMGEGAPFTQWQSITASGTQLHDLNRLSINQIDLQNSTSRIHLSESRQLVDLEWLLQKLQTPGQETQPAQSEKPGPPFQVQIGQVLLHGQNKLNLVDAGVKPPYKTEFDISRLELNQLDTASNGKTAFFLKAKNKFSTLEAKGDLALFSGNYDGSWKLDLKGFELPQVSPYSLRYTGYYMLSGQLSLSTEGTIKDRVLKGDSDIRLNKLDVEARHAKRSDAFDQKVSMPLGTAIMVLQDNDDNVDLQIPIDGSLDDPQFGYQTVINKLAGKGLKSAAMGYLTNALQPFGTLITIGKMVADAQSKGTFISLQPVYFQPGQSELSAESQQYIDKIAKMMQERKAMRITICGQAVQQDQAPLREALLKQNREKDKPLSEEQLSAQLQAELEALAEARSNQIKGMLTDQKGIDIERLFNCYPKVDLQSEEKPRAQLGL